MGDSRKKQIINVSCSNCSHPMVNHRVYYTHTHTSSDLWLIQQISHSLLKQIFTIQWDGVGDTFIIAHVAHTFCLHPEVHSRRQRNAISMAAKVSVCMRYVLCWGEMHPTFRPFKSFRIKQVQVNFSFSFYYSRFLTFSDRIFVHAKEAFSGKTCGCGCCVASGFSQNIQRRWWLLSFDPMRQGITTGTNRKNNCDDANQDMKRMAATTRRWECVLVAYRICCCCCRRRIDE